MEDFVMRSVWTAGIVAVTGVFAIGHVAHAEVIHAPTLVATDFQHTYFVGGKTTITTRIADSVQLATAPAWTPTWHDPATWVSTLTAPDGYRFVVTPAPGFGQPTTMNVATNWNVSTPVTDYTVFFSTTSYTFDGMTGTAPTFASSSSVVGQALYCLEARANFSVSEPFSFTSVTFTTTPPYNLEVFPTQTYYPTSRLELSITGNGSFPDATLISLQPIPEPASLVMLAVGSLTLLMFRHGQRVLGKLKRGHG
jgi:hypothetical protein